MGHHEQKPQSRVLLLFWDVVVYGKNDPESNPMIRARLPNLQALLGGVIPHLGFRCTTSDSATMIPLDANLRVQGLPQSGTGQVSLFTGVNAARLIGRHFGPHPPTTLHSLLESKNIFRQLGERQLSRCFANAFPRQFFEYAQTGTKRLSASTLSCKFADLKLMDAENLGKNEAVSPDITRVRWAELGYPRLPVITPGKAGIHLWKIAQRHSFTLFEYWLTDYAGHARDMAHAVEILERFDGLLGGVLEHFDPKSCTLIITSDHGNIEDLTTKSHTRVPVPCIIAGRRRRQISSKLKNLTHVTPAILSLLS